MNWLYVLAPAIFILLLFLLAWYDSKDSFDDEDWSKHRWYR
jgi:hypothetical protein